MTALRLGVVGAGRWGMNVIRTAARLGVLAAVCESEPAALAGVRSQFDNVALYDNFSVMISDAELDAVAIAAPAPMHAPQALEAIRAGLGVLVEKPLAMSVDEAAAVVNAARERGTTLVVGHLLLYHPAVRTMLAMIEDGAIGSVRHLRSRRLGWGTLRAHEDVWWSFAPHDVSVMLEVMREEPLEALRNSGAFVRPHIADLAYVDFRFSGGRSAHIEVAWIDPEPSRRVDVFGSEGVLSFVDSRAGATLTLQPCGARLGTGGEPELWQNELQCIPVAHDEPLQLELKAFCAAMRGGPVPPTNGEEGLAVVRTLALASVKPLVGVPS